MQQYILGIDIGTGSCKCVAIDLNGNVIGNTQQPYKTYSTERGFSEQDPELIWQAFINSISDLINKLRQPPLAVGLSCAMHGVIAADNKGKAITAILTWADARSESIASDFRNSVRGEHFYKLTGTPIHPMSPLFKLIWLRKNKVEIFKKARKFISIKEYIWFKLFRKFQIDYSVASATGLFDIQNLCWSEDACQLAGITTDQLSEPVNTNYIRKDICKDAAELLHVLPDTPFIIGAGDGCCASVGSFATKPGIAALTIGTSGAIRVTSPNPIYNYSAMIFNYRLDEKTFVSGGAVNNGGNVVDWLMGKFIGNVELKSLGYDALFNGIDPVPAGSGGLIFLPYLYGERAPIWNPKSNAAFLNIRPEHTQNHFIRAALEGICYALNDVLNSLEESSVSIKQINVSGGITSSVIWMQLLSDITGKILYVLQQEDASATGAAYLSRKALFPKMKRPRPNQDNGLVITPNLEKHQLYIKGYLVYKKIYINIEECMNILYDLN